MAMALPAIPAALTALVGGTAATAVPSAAIASSVAASGIGAGVAGAGAAAGGITAASALTAASTALSAGLAAKQLLTKNALPNAPKTTPLPDDAALVAARRRKLATEIAANGQASTQLTAGSRATLGG